ncbi:MAG: hypothetical protein IIZ06_06575 [Kiritimatiellae bacterium]|nr:hypothetical protein [Kiritimatiellia bacterium]
MTDGFPRAEVVEAWMKNHVCTPKDGIPKSFIDPDGIEWRNENADDNEGTDLL